MHLIPVSKISIVVSCSVKAGGSLWIGQYSSTSISPFSSIGFPRRLNSLPNVLVPTGTFIGPPVLITSSPLLRPSVESIATHLTVLSPISCSTSSTNSSLLYLFFTIKAS